jgi:hypothetical protein
MRGAMCAHVRRRRARGGGGAKAAGDGAIHPLQRAALDSMIVKN